VLQRVIFELLLQARETAGREPNASTGVIDGQSVKTTETGGRRGFHAAKKIKGRKRRLVTDTTGLLVGAQLHPADAQDRDGASLVIAAIHDLFPWVRHLLADSAYAGNKLMNALTKCMPQGEGASDRMLLAHGETRYFRSDIRGRGCHALTGLREKLIKRWSAAIGTKRSVPDDRGGDILSLEFPRHRRVWLKASNRIRQTT
jgi:hypothetical protein